MVRYFNGRRAGLYPVLALDRSRISVQIRGAPPPKWHLGQVVKTLPFHGGNISSILIGVTMRYQISQPVGINPTPPFLQKALTAIQWNDMLNHKTIMCLVYASLV